MPVCAANYQSRSPVSASCGDERALAAAREHEAAGGRQRAAVAEAARVDVAPARLARDRVPADQRAVVLELQIGPRLELRVDLGRHGPYQADVRADARDLEALRRRRDVSLRVVARAEVDEPGRGLNAIGCQLCAPPARGVTNATLPVWS